MAAPGWLSGREQLEGPTRVQTESGRRLDHAVRGERKGATQRGGGGGWAATKGTDTKMSGLCRDQKLLEGKASPRAADFRVGFWQVLGGATDLSQASLGPDTCTFSSVFCSHAFPTGSVGPGLPPTPFVAPGMLVRSNWIYYVASFCHRSPEQSHQAFASRLSRRPSEPLPPSSGLRAHASVPGSSAKRS